MIKKLLPILVLTLLYYSATAQPFLLKSTTGNKPFSLDIYYGTEGKGAFVQYRGQEDIIPLRLKSHTSKGKVGQTTTSYVWDEVIKGVVTGSYGVTQQADKLSGLWYKNNNSQKRFLLVHDTTREDYGGVGKYLLHGTLISFHHTAEELLSFNYADGSTKSSHLPEFDSPDPQRKATIADYNFDGYDDLAFSIPDAGMGVYHYFSIYLYNPATKRFDKLAEPDAPQASCSGLCDVTLDKKNKLLLTACRGAARWWNDVYKFSGKNKLIWVCSGKTAN